MTNKGHAPIKHWHSHRYAKSLLETVLEAVPVPVFFKDNQGRYLGCNEAFTRLMGIDADTLSGKTVMDLWPSDLALTYHEKDMELLRKPHHQEYEFRIRRWDGQIRDVIFSKNVFRDETGNVAGIVGAFTDITDLKAAQTKAEAALRTKDRFLANLNHEVRTPLNGILGMAQLLLFPDLSEDDRTEFAHTIHQSGQNLLAMLNAVIDLSMAEAGVLHLHQGVFEPSQLLDETRESFLVTAREKGLALVSTWNGPIHCRYQGDTNRLNQMLSNLVDNAVKFTNQGEVRIDARPVTFDGGVKGIEFSVVDTGIGISADKLASLFQPFTQADDSETRRHGGAGLGLSIVRKLALLMQGDAGAESTPGQGSRFWFRVAMITVEEEAESDRRNAHQTNVQMNSCQSEGSQS